VAGAAVVSLYAAPLESAAVADAAAIALAAAAPGVGAAVAVTAALTLAAAAPVVVAAVAVAAALPLAAAAPAEGAAVAKAAVEGPDPEALFLSLSQASLLFSPCIWRAFLCLSFCCYCFTAPEGDLLNTSPRFQLNRGPDTPLNTLPVNFKQAGGCCRAGSWFGVWGVDGHADQDPSLDPSLARGAGGD
jgi:hypothetical protein